MPLQAPELAVAELVRMVKELGLRGVEICTNVAGAELSDQRFRPFFAKCEELRHSHLHASQRLHRGPPP